MTICYVQFHVLQKNIELKIFKIWKEKMNIVHKKILVDIDDSGIIVRFCQSISDKEKTTVRLLLLYDYWPDERHGGGLLLYEPAEDIQHGHRLVAAPAATTTARLKRLLQERQDNLQKKRCCLMGTGSWCWYCSGVNWPSQLRRPQSVYGWHLAQPIPSDTTILTHPYSLLK